jgi:hypothetical protein
MFTAFLDRVDDWLNPIVVKELRQAVKSRIVVGILILFLGLQVVMLGYGVLVRSAQQEFASDWNAGRSVFLTQQMILLWAVMVFVPAYATIRMANERADQNVDLMLVSTMKPTSIIWGKFAAAFALGLLVFSSCAPFMTFSYLLRGIDIPTILLVLGCDLLALIFGALAGLLLAAIPGPRVFKFAVCFVGFVLLVVACSYTSMMTWGMIQVGRVGDLLLENLAATSLIVLVVLTISGLFAIYAVALIKPSSANRMFAVRVYLAAVVVVVVSSVLVFATANIPTVSPGMSMGSSWAGIPVDPLLATLCLFSDSRQHLRARHLGPAYCSRHPSASSLAALGLSVLLGGRRRLALLSASLRVYLRSGHWLGGDLPNEFPRRR